MALYEVRTGHDELGGKYIGTSMVILETDNLQVAIREAQRLTHSGRGGIVHRTSDGADCDPDLSARWLDSDGTEID